MCAPSGWYVSCHTNTVGCRVIDIGCLVIKMGVSCHENKVSCHRKTHLFAVVRQMMCVPSGWYASCHTNRVGSL